MHGIPWVHHAVEAAGAAVGHGAMGGLWQALATNLLNALAGLAAGGVVLAGVLLVQRLRKPGGVSR